ncbi:MAG TPA: thiol peroxidase [Candidatus Acidoferrales bacterium]|nr:thiol peroxidase [Candidatus Acidoferrales bacterium]HVB76425.1 thiol peroxidase [Candidatus Nitrosotalea sp.]
MTEESRDRILLGDKPLTIIGAELHAGDRAPKFELFGKGFIPDRVSSEDFAGQVLILSCVPSLDTSVCDRETKRWDTEVQKLDGKVSMLTVSMDLNFSQAKWCGANGTQHTTASAHGHPEFGVAYGDLIKENGLLARAVFVVGRDGSLVHVEYCRHIGDEPNYEEILAKAVAAA